jgi:hypothetical protein
VSFVSSASLKSYKSNQIKIEDINYADSIINFFKASGKLYVKDNYLQNPECNIYFDNLNELEGCLNNYSANVATTKSDITLSSRGKSNVAFIEIEDESGDTNINSNNDPNKKVDIYSVLVKVWNFQYGNSSEVKFKFYIGR